MRAVEVLLHTVYFHHICLYSREQESAKKPPVLFCLGATLQYNTSVVE